MDWKVYNGLQKDGRGSQPFRRLLSVLVKSRRVPSDTSGVLKMVSVSRILLLATVCCYLSYGAVFDPYSRRYAIFKATMNDLLVTPAGSTRTTLVQGLYALTTKAGFSSAENVTFTSWVQNIEVNIIQNAAITPEQQKFLRIAAAMQELSLDESVIYGKVQFLNISTWSAFQNIIHISREWTFEQSLELIVATSASGDCKLFDLLIEASAGDPTKQAALQAFIDSDLKAIVSDTTKTQAEIAVAVRKAFEESFFVGAQASWKTFFYPLQLNGFFAFSQWSDAANSYYLQTRYDTLLSGSGMECPFILALNATLSFPAYTVTQKGFIKQLLNYFIQQFEGKTVDERLELISMKFSECIDLSYGYFAVLGGIDIPDWGSFYELVIFSCQRTNFPSDCGCVVPTFVPQPGSTGQAGSSQATDSSSATDVTEATPSGGTDESSGATDITSATDETAATSPSSDTTEVTPTDSVSDSTAESSSATEVSGASSPSVTDVTASSSATDSSDATDASSPSATEITPSTSLTDATSNASEGVNSQGTEASSIFTTASIVPSTVSDCECMCA